jgi:hypothetical protein
VDSPAQSFRDLFLFSFSLSSNSNYNKTQDTNNLKLIKMKNITRSIIALFAVVALSCSVEDVQDRPISVNSPVLTTPTAGAAYVLKPENLSCTMGAFTANLLTMVEYSESTYAVE